MIHTSNKSTVLGLLERVWGDGDLSAVDDYIGENYTVFHDPGDPWEGHVLDRDMYRDRVRKSRAPFPDQRFDVQNILAEGDDVVVTWLWKGTHLGEIAGFTPTGQSISMSGMTLYSFSGGKVVGHWQCVDRLGVHGQLRQARHASQGRDDPSRWSPDP